MLTLVPAYGRDYKSKAAILADLEAGKDFLAVSYDRDGYINIEGLREHGIKSVNVRYGKLRKVAVIQVP